MKPTFISPPSSPAAAPSPALPAPHEPSAPTQVTHHHRHHPHGRPRVLGPPPGVDLSTLRGLNFTMMETECVSGTRVNPDDCDFKENGVIKECTGPVLFLQSSPEIDLRCTDASSDPVLVQRGRFGRFLSRIRRVRPRINFYIRAKGSISLG
uniref:Uncharacterized protein n=1 Tax=Buteo japonicus TaxID=224669 RepID=A0A8C0B9X4_9AVES